MGPMYIETPWMKEMGWLKKENLRVDHEGHESIWVENAKQYAKKIENIQQNKWKKKNGSK